MRKNTTIFSESARKFPWKNDFKDGWFHILVPCDLETHCSFENICTNPWEDYRLQHHHYHFKIGDLDYIMFVPPCVVFSFEVASMFRKGITPADANSLFEELTGYHIVQIGGQHARLHAVPPQANSGDIPIVYEGSFGRRYALEIHLNEMWGEFLRSRKCKSCGRIPTKDDYIESSWSDDWGWPRKKDFCSVECFLTEQSHLSRIEKSISKSRTKKSQTDLETFLAIGAINEQLDEED